MTESHLDRRPGDSGPTSAGDTPVVFLDLEDVIIEHRPGRQSPPYTIRPGAEDGLQRLSQITDRLVALVEPPAPGAKRPRSFDSLDGIQSAIVPGGPDLMFVGCPHGPNEHCDCRKPEHGLVVRAVELHGGDTHTGWHISGSQEGVQAGRAAGLRTIRIGPPSEDHLTAVHRADYDARDLLDAANWILVSTLQGVHG